MRLIDADTFKIRMMQKYDDVEEYLDDIDEQPTAYDVDKVVEELTDNAIDETGIDYEMDISLDDAIVIVKRGGVE